MNQPSTYPVDFQVEPQLTGRNRATGFFRIILAIPHLLLVGGPGGIGGGISFGLKSASGGVSSIAGSGALGLVAGIMALVSWFAIVFTGKQPRGLWDFQVMYLRWRTRANAYTALLRDEYPPFGDGDGSYPAVLVINDFPEVRNKGTVALRLFYVIPHVICLILLGIAWLVTYIIGWLSITFTGAYPEGLYNFGVGYMRWSLRVEAYFLLLNDEFPPFSLT